MISQITQNPSAYALLLKKRSRHSTYKLLSIRSFELAFGVLPNVLMHPFEAHFILKRLRERRERHEDYL